MIIQDKESFSERTKRPPNVWNIGERLKKISLSEDSQCAMDGLNFIDLAAKLCLAAYSSPRDCSEDILKLEYENSLSFTKRMQKLLKNKLINQSIYDEAKTLNNIRNGFAHSFNAFTIPEAECQNLLLIENYLPVVMESIGDDKNINITEIDDNILAIVDEIGCSPMYISLDPDSITNAKGRLRETVKLIFFIVFLKAVQINWRVILLLGEEDEETKNMIQSSAAQDRLTRLETRLTEQEAVIDDLNKTITEQWRLIDRLSRQVAALREQVETAGERGDPRAPDPPPPHY